VRRAILAVISVLALLAPRPALAVAPDAGGNLAAAQADFAADLASAAAADCATACRALESLRRAADAICVLDPGSPCASARADLDKSTARVRASCPDCPSAAENREPSPEPSSPDAKSENGFKGAPEAPAPASAPPGHGGCASCTVSGAKSEPAAPLAVAGLAVLLLRKRRTNRVRSSPRTRAR
jgi:MYXO-CTERM domain-containing protein